MSLGKFVQTKKNYKEDDLEPLADFLFDCNEKYDKKYSKKRKRDSIKLLVENDLKKLKFETSFTLPIEIWEIIIEFTSDINVLTNLSKINKEFYDLSQNELLWNTMLKNCIKLFQWEDVFIEETEIYLKSKLKSLKQENKEITSKMKIIYMYEKCCLKCHRHDGRFWAHLDGHLCYGCGSKDFKLISTSEAKKSPYNLTQKLLNQIPSDKHPTTRQGLKYIEDFEVNLVIEISKRNGLYEK